MPDILSESDLKEFDDAPAGGTPQAETPSVVVRERDAWQNEFDEEDEEAENEAAVEDGTVTPAVADAPIAETPPAAVAPAVSVSPTHDGTSSIGPPAPAQPPVAEVQAPEAPTTYNDWALTDDGNDIFSEAMEDPSSEAAQEIKDEFGEAEYVKLMAEYQRDKTQYGEVVRAREYEQIRTGTQTLKTAQGQLSENFKGWLAPLTAAQGEEATTAILKDYDAEAGRLLEATRTQVAAHLISQGVPEPVAVRRATAIVLSDKQAYENCLGMAILSDLGGFVQRLLAPKSITPSLPAGGNSPPPVAPAAAPPVAVTSRPTPPPLSTGGSGGRVETTAPRGYTTEEVNIAKQLGYTPQQFTERRAKLRN